MGNVRVLSDDLVSLISAGEVIENPASIVKELLENSLDAGATNIDISIMSGGTESIIVSDNGTGILKEDCPVCTLRYSTSKISTKEDIESILTYGFRGEALASVAAVADLVIVTKHEGEEIGSKLVSRAGEIPILEDASRPDGTTVEVTGLFKHVPARRKHLSDSRVESQRVLDIVMRHAIIRNDIGFRLTRDERVALDCPPGQSARDRVLHLWGPEVASSLVEFLHKSGEIIVTGFIALPPVSRGNRGRQYFSVRNRPIQDIKLNQAVERAYSSLLMIGRFPICAVNIELDVKKVDTNAHPTKREVRIQDYDSVVESVRVAVREALGKDRPVEAPLALQDFVDTPLSETLITAEGSDDDVTFSARMMAEQPLLFERVTLEELIGKEEDTPEEITLGGAFKILGQIQDLYILLEFDYGLVIVDQHAAHERVLYEQLRTELKNRKIAYQELLEPIVLRLGPSDRDAILSSGETLEALGYTIESFGGNEVLVSTLPEVFGRRATENELVALVDRIVDLGPAAATEEFMDQLLKVIACHSAIRAGEKLSHKEIAALLVDLAESPNRYNCAHGRPSLIKLTRKELDKRFGRDGPQAMARFRARHQVKD
ncbi:MAG: DNA mismatch repair endonuclease MutL [Candidatus Thorarchaeota archaeon]|jgi:DNA mismatch repair protein MutL